MNISQIKRYYIVFEYLLNKFEFSDYKLVMTKTGYFYLILKSLYIEDLQNHFTIYTM